MPPDFELSDMARPYHRFLVVFVDGVGLAPASTANPFSAATMPYLTRILGGPLTAESTQAGNEVLLRPIDACLGVDGLPQSATGQATLFTGVNAAAELGRHVTGLPGPRVRAIVEGRGILRRAVAAGFRTTFANAYTSGYLASLERGDSAPSVTTCLCRSAGLRLRTTKDLETGRAVTWDIVGDLYGSRAGVETEPTKPEAAGQRLARISADYDLTLFETFLPDLAGHQRIEMPPAAVVSRLDRFLEGLLESRAGVSVILVSDHGNLEDPSSRRHTRTPVPLFVVGPAAPLFAEARSVADATPIILGALGTVAF